MHRRTFLALAAAASLAAACDEEEKLVITDPENTLVMQLDEGKVHIQLLPDVAPRHVARIKDLARRGFYDGLAFHRVIDGFMAQTGDPKGTGNGGSGRKIDAEFSKLPFERGTVGMARGKSRDSADSQFFIMFERQPSLDGRYTVFGKVIGGMKVVDRLARGEPPSNPDRIISLYVLSDL